MTGAPYTGDEGRIEAVGRAADEQTALLLVRLRLDNGERIAGTVGYAAADSMPINFDGWLEFMLAVADLRKRSAGAPVSERSDTPP